jgi:hypothetical protein
MIFGFVHAISILEFNIFWHIAQNTSGCFGLVIQLLMKTSRHVHGGFTAHPEQGTSILHKLLVIIELGSS